MDTAFAQTLMITMASLAALAMVTRAGLKAFLAWVEMKQANVPDTLGLGPSHIGNRIELADLKERLRRLEAIAAGIDV